MTKFLFKTFLVVILSVLFAVHAADATTLDLGGLKLRLPGIKVQPRPTNPSYGSSIYSQPRWHVVMQDAHQFATNDQGVWIGYDERGAMVMQIQFAVPASHEAGAKIPVQVLIDGRLYQVVQATVANKGMVVVHGIEVERILGRLARGRRLTIMFDNIVIETHLRGSNAAIRSVRSAAAVQARLFAQGLIKPRAQEKQTTEDKKQIAYFLPGVKNKGKAEVTFNIIEGSGLILYMRFDSVPGHNDPNHKVPLTRTEARRVIALLEKSERWTEIARKERVGLFSKRIGFVDDELNPEDGQKQTSQVVAESAPGGVGSSTSVGATTTDATTEPQPSDTQEPQTGLRTNADDPKDFTAVNFNSYEDGSTSAQIEHSVSGFSRRFNMTIENALKLAKSLDSTIEYASYRLENRQFDMEEKSKLFR